MLQQTTDVWKAKAVVESASHVMGQGLGAQAAKHLSRDDFPKATKANQVLGRSCTKSWSWTRQSSSDVALGFL